MGANSYEAYKKYTKGIYGLKPISLRDLIDFKSQESIDIDEVEPITQIMKSLEVEVCLMELYLKKHMKLLQWV